MKKVAVLGWYGHHNLGDELMLQGIRDLFPTWNIQAFTNDAGLDVPIFDAETVNQFDLFVLGGGEIINSDSLFIAPSEINKVKIPKIALGVGVNASSLMSSAVLDALRSFKYIGTRDFESCRFLGKFFTQTSLFYDLGFGAIIPPPTMDPTPNSVLVAPTDRVTDEYDEGILQLNLSKNPDFKLAFKGLVSPFGVKVFLPFGGDDNDDYQTCLELSEGLTDVSILHRQGMSNSLLFAAYQLSTYVIGFRLHSLLLAYRYGKPFRPIYYHRKIVNNLTTWKCLSLPEIMYLQKAERDRVAKAYQ